jgi:hypothetical protein
MIAAYRLELEGDAGKNRNGIDDLKNFPCNGIIRDDA